jgi:hypothetical protein
MMREGSDARGWNNSDRELFERILVLPHRLMQHHSVHGLSQLVLHDMSGPRSFGFERSVFLADNPDFDHLQGIAGYCKDEHEKYERDPWEDPVDFLKCVSGSRYHGDIRSVLKSSLQRESKNFEKREEIEQLAHEIGMKKPEYLSWTMKHGNHGLLIYELEEGKLLTETRERMLHGATGLLSMCCMAL